MELTGSIAVVTGGASGIGRALSERFAQEGAERVIVADLNAEGAEQVAASIDGDAARVDVGVEADVRGLVERTLARYGRVDLFCSNAGITGQIGLGDDVEAWRRVYEINVMSHVYAVRAVLPSMLERGAGYLLSTASAAGLLTQLGAAQYAVTKHAAVALAEWLAIEYHDAGIRSSCLCPMGVRTGMLNESAGPSFLLPEMIEPEQVAEDVVLALREERFLILPHPQAATYLAHKVSDNERWLQGMRRMRRQVGPDSWTVDDVDSGKSR